MSFISRLSSCFPWRVQEKYTALAKKDDNFAIEQAENWVDAHPIDYIQQEIRYSNKEKINKYANEVIQSLNKLPITSLNLEILIDHMVKMSEKSDLLKQSLIKKIQFIKAEKSLIISIVDKLSSTFETLEYK